MILPERTLWRAIELSAVHVSVCSSRLGNVACRRSRAPAQCDRVRCFPAKTAHGWIVEQCINGNVVVERYRPVSETRLALGRMFRR
jgi:hypothetical protein